MNPFPRLLLAVALLAIALVSSACTSTTYIAPNGAKFSRTSFLNRQSIGKVEFSKGDEKLSIEGYSNEQTEVAAAVASSVAKALAPALAVPK